MRRSWAGLRGSRTKETERGGTIPSDYDKRLGKNKRVALGEPRQPRRRDQARQGGDGVPARPSVLVATGRKQGELATIEGRETRSLRTTGDDTETTQTLHRRDTDASVEKPSYDYGAQWREGLQPDQGRRRSLEQNRE